MANQDLNPANGNQGSSYLYDYGTTPETRVAVSQKVRLKTPVYGASTRLRYQIGVVSSFGPSQSRSVEPVRGIGFGDQVAELVPGVTEPETASIERAMLYLNNLWQATGYAAGRSGPVRSLRHHRWPFDIEQQLVFSTLADSDVGEQFTGASFPANSWQGGNKGVSFPAVTQAPPDQGGNQIPDDPRHTALITMYEACWFTSWSTTYSQDAGIIMESGEVTVSDVHDFSTLYGEFLATGNDPTIGQLGSIRYGFGEDTA